MSLYDFYMYLKHIEYSPENLEFYIWYGYSLILQPPSSSPTNTSRFKNYEARYAERESGTKETASSTTVTRPASPDGSEVSLDPEFGTMPTCTTQQS